MATLSPVIRNDRVIEAYLGKKYAQRANQSQELRATGTPWPHGAVI
jgi:hypothetical protein